MAFLYVCLCIIAVFAVFFILIGGTLFLWKLFNDIFYKNYGYWHNWYNKEVIKREEIIRKQLEEEYKKKLKEETIKILTDFYEKDGRKNNENNIQLDRSGLETSKESLPDDGK